MLIKLTWRLAIVPIVLSALILFFLVGLPIVSPAAVDAPRSEAESPAQTVEDSFELLGCEDNICVYQVDVPYGASCVLAIQTFVMDQNVFDLECPGS